MESRKVAGLGDRNAKDKGVRINRDASVKDGT